MEIAVVATALATALATRAQIASAQFEPVTVLAPSTFAIETRTGERWMHAGQQPRFTRFIEQHRWQIVDSAQRRGAARQTGGLLWTFAPSVPPVAPRIGLTWTDTMTRDTTDGSVGRTLRGRRVSTIIGDTSVAGRHLWRVRDTAVVVYEERYTERERTLDTTVQIARVARGVIRGTRLYDAALGLDAMSDDTTRLAGTATLRYPDGRTFQTTARFEATGHAVLLDAPAYADRIAELRTARERGRGGMLLVPTTDIQRRLANGDARLTDSLVAVWRRTDDPAQADELFNQLEMWAVHDADARRHLDSVRVAAGDTAFLYLILARRSFQRGHSVDAAEARAMIRFMNDPGLVWRVGQARDELYENAAAGLMQRPPAAHFPDSACTPEGCATFAAQRLTASARTGRDIVGEWRRSYDAAKSDTARYVFAVMLERMGGLELSEAEIADALTSGVSTRIAEGMQKLANELDESSALAPDSTASALADRVLAALADGTPLWRPIDPASGMTSAHLPETHIAPRQLYVRVDSLPAAAQRWQGRLNFITGAEWARRGPRTAGVLYSIAPVRAWGRRFARVEVRLSEQVGRDAADVPELYAAGKTYYLMLVGAEWVLVDEDGWIT
jgi:hypothetical protein